MNRIIIMGRLTRDPELRRTQSGMAVASFNIAVDRPFSGRNGGEKQTDFIDCVAWDKRGEFVSKYFVKGQMCLVEGRLQIRDWTDKEGNKRKSAEIVADTIEFTESKKSRDASGYAPAGGQNYGGNDSYNSGYQTPVSGSDFAELDDEDGDLPF